AAQKKARETGMTSLDFAPAQAAAQKFILLAQRVQQKQLHLDDDSTATLTALNTQLRQVEEDFLSEQGLPGRPWFKHTVYAPGEYTGYAAVVIPGVNEAIDAKDSARAAAQLTVLT